MPVIKIYDWPCSIGFRVADPGHTRPSVAGEAYFTGQPQNVRLVTPARFSLRVTGVQKFKGPIEVIRNSLYPANLVRMVDPTWWRGRSAALRSLATNVVWSPGAAWGEGVRWATPETNLQVVFSAQGGNRVTIGNLPRFQEIFRHGDMIGIHGAHYMVAGPASSNDLGRATVHLVKTLQAPIATGDFVEFPVRHLFTARIGIVSGREAGVAFDWEGNFREVFKSDFPGATYETDTFFK